MVKNSGLINQWLIMAAQGAVLLAVAGCAQPSVTASVSIPPIPAGEARIWFYRDYEPYADRGLPAIAANGRYVGAAELGGAFYRDVPPGNYAVTVETTGVDFNQVAHLDLTAGREAYVKVVSLPSWETGGDRNEWRRPTFYAWLIPNQVAQADVARLSFHGGS
ncbi:MAG: hypothetical protein JOY83_29210 [Alphaproteobacteria bacterium]|nr:hypothetical protein [Alphaproteobacteria bacterium]